MFLLKKFCEKREFISLKTCDIVHKWFWWWVCVQKNKIVMYSMRENHGNFARNWYVQCKITNLCRNFRNISLFSSVNISNPQKLSARSDYFSELGSQVPPLFAALHSRGSKTSDIWWLWFGHIAAVPWTRGPSWTVTNQERTNEMEPAHLRRPLVEKKPS